MNNKKNEHPLTKDYLTPNTGEKIIVLDFGGQYSMLISRRIREAKVYCKILPYYTPAAEVFRHSPRGIILSGGPGSVYLENPPECDPAILNGEIPVLGICYGMQLMASRLGGNVERGRKKEVGRTGLIITESEPLFNHSYFKDSKSLSCWMSHQDEVIKLPPGFSVLARTESGAIAAMGDVSRHLYGLQFHPEVSHTPGGLDILKSFLYDICHCSGNWAPLNFIEQAVMKIRNTVNPGEKVICALSGGLDSSVVALLLNKSIGKDFVSIFVDHGLLRRDEAQTISSVFREQLQGKFIEVDARDRFLQKLKGVTLPEEKRKVIGTEFIEVFRETALSMGNFSYLAQGTIYPDIVESGADAGTATIKSHHNVGGLPDNLNFTLIEPLRELFKDEVREVGRRLGLPEVIASRQPFPGPGLAVRIIGEVTAAKLELLQEADAIFREEIEKENLNDELWQFFAVLTGIQAVGIRQGKRVYGQVICLRATTSTDGMTADWYRLPYEFLHRVSTRITAEIPQIARVVYDITAKPPGTIEWE